MEFHAAVRHVFKYFLQIFNDKADVIEAGTVFHEKICFRLVEGLADDFEGTDCRIYVIRIEGVVTVFVGGSTGGITTIEFESGAVNDLKKAIERIAPQDIHYDHDARWGDGNGFSHVRAALLGPSLHIPMTKKQLLLGTWQQIVFCDFDNRPRHRRIAVQVIGE